MNSDKLISSFALVIPAGPYLVYQHPRLRYKVRKRASDLMQDCDISGQRGKREMHYCSIGARKRKRRRNIRSQNAHKRNMAVKLATGWPKSAWHTWMYDNIAVKVKM